MLANKVRQNQELNQTANKLNYRSPGSVSFADLSADNLSKLEENPPNPK